MLWPDWEMAMSRVRLVRLWYWEWISSEVSIAATGSPVWLNPGRAR